MLVKRDNLDESACSSYFQFIALVVTCQLTSASLHSENQLHNLFGNDTNSSLRPTMIKKFPLSRVRGQSSVITKIDLPIIFFRIIRKPNGMQFKFFAYSDILNIFPEPVAALFTQRFIGFLQALYTFIPSVRT